MSFLTRILATVTVLLVLLPALGGLDTDPVVAQSPITIVIGTTDFPRSLDPATAVDLPSVEVLNHLFTGLTRQVPGTLQFELALAANHTVSTDGLVHRFTIRDDAAFADGTPITAATFARSINRVLRLGREGAEVINRYITGATVEVGNILTITLKAPLADVEALVALPQFFPLPPAIYPDDAVLEAENTETLIGNGLYRLAAFQADRELTLIPQAPFPGQPAANDRVVLRRYALPIDLRRALQNGEIDLAWRALAEPDLEVLTHDPTLNRLDQPNLQTYYLLLNHTPMTVGGQDSFDDLAFRRAFALLIDRESSAHVGMQDTVMPLSTILPPELGIEGIEFPARDPLEADSILSEAGYRPRRRPLNTTLSISTDAYGDRMANAAADLRRAIQENRTISITAINNSLTPTFLGVINRGEYLSAIIGWRPAFPAPAAYFIPLMRSDSPIPLGAGYGNAALDSLLLAAELTASVQERERLYSAIQTEILASVDLIPLWQGKDVLVYHRAISGVQLEHNSWLHYETLSRRP